MCGRFTLKTPAAELAKAFELDEMPLLEARYNIAPTQDVAAVLQPQGAAKRRLVLFRWGLIPSWADDPSFGARTINARSETAASKPAFRAAFRERRCLIAADGFYEWQAVGEGKQPFYITIDGGGPFAFAGLWEHWRRDEREIDSCTILTTSANERMKKLHDRMPVILDRKDWSAWLDPATRDPERLTRLLTPFAAERMHLTPVDKRVNSPKNDDPSLVEPAAGWRQGKLFD